MNIRITVDDQEVVRALRGARRDMRRKVRDIQGDQAKRIVLPVAKRLSPSFAKSSMEIRARAGGVFLAANARGTKRATIGVANFGGTIRAPIHPKAAQALRLADGGFVGKVTGPRKIAGLHWFEKSIDRTRDEFLLESSEAIADWLQRYVRGQRALSRVA